MSDSTTNLNTIQTSQAAKEVTANGLFDAMSPASLFGRHDSECAALTWGYYGGKYRKADGTVIMIANATLSLMPSATNYLKETDGVVSVTTAAPTGWPGPLASGATALYAIVCGASSAIGYTDYRAASPGNIPAQPFDVVSFYPGAPTASAILLRIPFARTVSFLAAFAGSCAAASVAATAQTDFTVLKNGGSIGTVRFAAAAATATFIAGTATSFAAGDILSIVAPATPDATLSDVGIVLAGTR
jgi:hypothetical protein